MYFFVDRQKKNQKIISLKYRESDFILHPLIILRTLIFAVSIHIMSDIWYIIHFIVYFAIKLLTR